MGLDFGLEKMNKKFFEQFDGSKDAYYCWMENHNYPEDYSDNLVNYCGWGNPAEKWFKEGLNYFDDYDGILMRALTPEDIYAVMNEAYAWYNAHINLKPVVLGSAFNESDNGVLTIMPIDGIEVSDEDGAYHRFYSQDSDGKLFVTKDYVDEWDIYKFPEFIHEMLDILQNFDWDNDVLLYYVSY